MQGFESSIKRLGFRGLLALAAGGVVGAPAQAAADLGKIMPLGDSITWGMTNSGLPNGSPGGYREHLNVNLKNAGYGHQFIGTVTDAVWSNPGPTLLADGQLAHEGHSGWRIDEIQQNLDGDTTSDGSGHFFQRAGAPDIILLHLGTNDIAQSYDPEYSGEPGTEDPVVFASHMADRMETLIDTIYSNGRNPQIFVGTIPIGGVVILPGQLGHVPYEPVPLFNAELENRVVPKYQALGRDITYVDLYNPFLLPDGSVNPALYGEASPWFAVHPSPAGYKLMGDLWTEAIVASVPEPASAGALTAVGAAMVLWRPGRGRPR